MLGGEVFPASSERWSILNLKHVCVPGRFCICWTIDAQFIQNGNSSRGGQGILKGGRTPPTSGELRRFRRAHRTKIGQPEADSAALRRPKSRSVTALLAIHGYRAERGGSMQKLVTSWGSLHCAVNARIQPLICHLIDVRSGRSLLGGGTAVAGVTWGVSSVRSMRNVGTWVDERRSRQH